MPVPMRNQRILADSRWTSILPFTGIRCCSKKLGLIDKASAFPVASPPKPNARTMKSARTSNCAILLVLAVMWSASLAGCGSRATPPGPSSVFGFVEPDLRFNFVLWKEGLAVMFVDNIGDQRHSSGHSSTGDPVYRQTGWARSKDGAEYNWEIRTSDGRTAELKINGVSYDIAKGTVFVILTGERKIAVDQLDLDLSGLFDVSDCRTFITKNRDRMATADDASDSQ